MSTIHKIGAWELNHQQQTINNGHQQIDLEPNQYSTLILLASMANQPVSKQLLLEHVWPGKFVTEDSIYVTINGLRKALGDDVKRPQYIRTISGKGYQLVAPIEFVAPIAKHSKPIWWLSVASALLVGLIWLFIWHDSSAKTPITVELSPNATEQFQRANYLMTLWPPEKQQAEALYRQVIAQHPDFAEAYIKLSAATMSSIFASDPAIYQQREQLVEQLNYALTLAPNNKEAHLLLANLYFLVLHDFAQAQAHFERSLASADSYYFYSQFLLAMGEFETAKQQLWQYISLYPQGYSGEGATWIYTMAGEYQYAEQELSKLAEFATPDSYYHVSRQALYELTGNSAKAFTSLKQLMQRAGYQQQHLDIVSDAYQKQGLAGVYNWLAFMDEQQLDIGQYTPPMSLARYATSAGEFDIAIDHLEQALEQRKIQMLWVAVDPKYRPLHYHPRFIELIDNIGLPQHLKAIKNN